MAQKKCVMHFVHRWKEVDTDKFQSSLVIGHFLDMLVKFVSHDCSSHPEMNPELEALTALVTSRKTCSSIKTAKKKSLFLSRKGSTKSGGSCDNCFLMKGMIRPTDECIYKVYCADHTYTSVRLLLGATVREIVASASDKLGLGNDPVLCEVTSSGERIVFTETDSCIMPALSVNGRLFIAPREHLDALTPLPEQEGPTSGTMASLEVMDAKDLATAMTQHDWELFSSISEQEILQKLFGLAVFPNGHWPNLDRFLHRFAQLQHWVITEMVLLPNLGKRVQLLRKLIKLAQHLKDLSNMQAFLAIMMGLGHLAVSRLSQTWEKLPGKTKKLFSELETQVDPARNHRAYRIIAAKMSAPSIPYMPLLMKDLNFINEGNDTYNQQMLVNFEKMRMVAQTLRQLRYFKQRPMELEPSDGSKVAADTKVYVKNFQVIDNQRILTNLSHKCEPRKG